MNNNLNNFLYRGQDIHNRKWVYGFLVIQEEKAFIVEYSNWIGDDYSEMVAKEVDIETVGQCTGYLDTKIIVYLKVIFFICLVGIVSICRYVMPRLRFT